MSAPGVVLLHTTSAAFRAEKLLKAAGLAIALIPTPRQFSSNCGFALRFDWAAADQVRTLLAAARVETEGIHPLSAE
jgi:hypothetical protein